MRKQEVSHGAVHTLSPDLQKIIISKAAVFAAWEDITSLSRNEWICWIESAKKQETRSRRIQIMAENLAAGKRRPCCWAGCAHR